MRVSEVYLSVQGEGPHVGFPTIFVRFGGCNLRCPLWPCDTPYAIFPEYRKEWLVYDPKELFAKVEEVRDNRFVNICFTGGEPFLQNHRDLKEFYDLCRASGGINFIEAFTNGTLAYPDWVGEDSIEAVLDWKLPGSGEHQTGFEERLKNIDKFNPMNLSIKFTIADRHDYDYAKEMFHSYLNESPFFDIYAGVVWGKLENQQLVEWILADGLPWKLNVQVHNHVWDRSLRGI